MKRHLRWLFLFVVILLPWLYGLGFPFLYDDIGMISENPYLADPGNASAVLTGRTLADPSVLNGRRPAVLATYFFDRAVHGLRPGGWRATNLLLHLANAALLAALAFRLSRRRTLAALVALLFALHPVLTEPVHSPGFRADVLCLFFSLLAIHAWLFATSGASRRGLPSAAWAATMLLFLAATLLSKETAVACPLAATLLFVLYPARFPRRRAALVLLVTAVALAVAFFVLWSVLPAELQAAAGSWNGESLRPPENLWSFPALWTRTLRLSLVPWPLNVTPRFDPVVSPADGRFWMGLFWMAVCATAAWKARHRLPTVALGLGWMAVWFLPVSNLWPLYHPVADRYLYPVVPGFALLAAWLLEQQPPVSRRLGAALIALLYAGLLLVRVHQWRTPETLWTAAWFQNSKSATAATWLGLLSEERGEPEAAVAFYRAATEANPRAVHAWIDWGVLEGRRGNLADAERLLLTALELSPSNSAAVANLAHCRNLLARQSPPP